MVNAGHNPGFLLCPGEPSRLFEAAGTPLGLLPGMHYTSERSGFTPGTRLLFYTDGLTEVFKGDEEFGPERLMDEFFEMPLLQARMVFSMYCGRPSRISLREGRREIDMTALALCREAGLTGMPA